MKSDISRPDPMTPYSFRELKSNNFFEVRKIPTSS